MALRQIVRGSASRSKHSVSNSLLPYRYQSASSASLPSASTAGLKGWMAGAVLAAAAGYGILYLARGKRSKEVLFRPADEKKPKLVVLGSGWSSLALLKEIELANYDVTVVSPRNYFLFTPLLPSATVGTVCMSSLTLPIRKYCKKLGKDGKTRMAQFYEAECYDIDPATQIIKCRDTSDLVGAVSEFDLEYDLLVMGVGSVSTTFNTPGVKENCFMVKNLEDAHKIRNRILDNFETASLPGQPDDEVTRLLEFVVVGGGPTGVEFAAELKDFIEEDLKLVYPDVSERAHVTLVQSNSHLLNTYSKNISEMTSEAFKKLNIDTVINSRVVEVTDTSVTIYDKQTKEKRVLPCGMCVWSTGVARTEVAKTLASKLPAHQNNRRAIVTDDKLRTVGAPNIFCLGDCGTISQDRLLEKFEELFREGDTDGDKQLSLNEFTKLATEAAKDYPQMRLYNARLEELFSEYDTNKDGVLSLDEFKNVLKEADSNLTALPATAQVAAQQGHYLATVLNHDLVKDPELHECPGFTYKHMGSLAYVGGNQAVMDLENMYFGGFVAWLMWRAAYWQMQHSLSTQIALAHDWWYCKFFGRDVSRS